MFFRNTFYYGKPKDLDLFLPRKHRLERRLIKYFKIIKVFDNIHADEFLTKAQEAANKRNETKLREQEETLMQLKASLPVTYLMTGTILRAK